MSKPDFVEPYPGWAREDKGPEILAVVGAMTGLAFLFVAARLSSRMIALGRLLIDDYIVILSILISILYVSLVAVAIRNGAGRHMITLPPENGNRAMYYLVISFLPAVLSFVLPKFAVAILLASILDAGPWHKRIMWAISILYLLVVAGAFVVNFGQCTPPAVQWGAAEGTCWDNRIPLAYGFTLAIGIYSAVFDFYLAFYATIVLYKMVMNRKKKLALVSALGFGYCAAAVASYKCYTLQGLMSLGDFTYAIDNLVIWTSIEGNFVLIGACIPTLYPLVKKLFGASALGGSKQAKDSGQQPLTRGPDGMVATIGSDPNKGKKRPRHDPLGLSQLDTIEDNRRDLEEPSFHASARELRAEEAGEQLEAVAAGARNPVDGLRFADLRI